MYERILVPTDGSECAAAATEHAVTIADRFDATLHACYVVDVDAVAHAAPELSLDDLRETLREEGAAATAAVAERAAESGVETVETVREGIPEEAIREYADEAAIDLVVMGTHGRQGLDRYLVGSVTERLVRRSDVPVVTVRGP